MNDETYSGLLKTGADKLRQAGVSEPVREARRIIELATGFTAAALIAREAETAAAGHIRSFHDFLDRRAKRAPFAHLKGKAWFYGLELKSDARALIPRPDSECVVDLALNLISENADWKIADLGTGTGALLAAILTHRPRAVGIGVEQNPGAHRLASENISLLGLGERADIVLGSWTEWDEWGTCDLIISNPPYIESKVIAELEPEVKDHDPLDALDGGEDGLDAYREIIGRGANKMKSGAYLVLEIGFDQKSSVSNLLKAVGFTDLTHKQDLGGNDRAIAAIKT